MEKSKNRIRQFFQEEYEKLLRYIRRLIDDTAERDAEDIIQDVMIHLFDKPDITIPIENLSAYIYKSVKNRIIDLFRKNQNIHPVDLELENLSLDLLMDEVGDNPGSILEKEEMNALLYQAIQSLNEKERALLVATEFDQRSFRSLSRDWGIPMGTLLTRKSRAIEKIKKKFQNYKSGK